MSSTRLLVLALLPTLMTACTPRVRVTKDPGPDDRGIRYYRPKPYLLVAAAEEKEGDNTRLSDRAVTLTLEYMPDFSEEYSIHVCPGLGTATVNVQLDKGWNLTKIDQTLDSQTDENLGAVANLLTAAGGLAGSSGEREGEAEGKKPICVMASRNVPLGFYESIIGRDCWGRKQLYGWRYVGFAPFSSCPLSTTGLECSNCQTMELFGLVFENDVMVFKPLWRIQQTPGDGQQRIDIVESLASDTPTPAASSMPSADFADLVRAAHDISPETELEVVSFTTTAITIKVADHDPDRFGTIQGTLTAMALEKWPGRAVTIQEQNDPTPQLAPPSDPDPMAARWPRFSLLNR